MEKPQYISASGVYLYVIAFCLALTAGAKLFSATGDVPILSVADPILRLSNRKVLIGVGLLELALASYVVLGRSVPIKHVSIVWLSVNFIAYRIALIWLAPGRPCSCLGNIGDRLQGMREILDWGLRALVACMFFGSLFFLLHPRVRAASQRRNQSRGGEWKSAS